jgi:hypothetical protein
MRFADDEYDVPVSMPPFTISMTSSVVIGVM